jgi:alkylated DNA repair dioxygenase AlkB
LPRSLVVFSGEVRFNWLHSIAERKIDKVSTKYLQTDNINGDISI